MSEKEFYQYILSLKKEIGNEIRDIVVAEFHLVQDYMKREMNDFIKKYDDRLKKVEHKLSVLIWTKMIIFLLLFIVILLIVILILNVN